jgi:hypothetical protein
MTPIVTTAQSTTRGSLEVNVSLFPSNRVSKDEDEGEDESAATNTADVSSSSKSDADVFSNFRGSSSVKPSAILGTRT